MQHRHDSPLATTHGDRYDAEPACVYPSTQAVYVITCVNHYQKSHHAEISVSLLSLALLLGISATAPAIAKTTAVATAAAQPQIASGSAMIVDLNTNKVILRQSSGSGAPVLPPAKS